MDADGRFTLGSNEFTELLGPRITSALGRTWDDVAAELTLDPEGLVRRALGTRDTWSGIKVAWPIEGSEERLTIELSGLPLYDRDRVFRGYRGFGVCRDTDRLARVAALRRAASAAALRAAPSRAKDAQSDAVDAASRSETIENVVRFPGPPVEPRPANDQALIPALSPVERSAFREIARQLSARLQIDDEAASEPPAPPPLRRPSPPDIVEPEQRVRRDGQETAVLDRLPIGILVYRYDQLLYANRAFLDATGYADLDTLRSAGGLDCLFVETQANADPDAPGKPIAISTARSESGPMAARLLATMWDGESAMMIAQQAPRIADDRARAPGKLEQDMRAMRRELEKATTAKSELLAKISHGVRTPLNSILGFSEVMLEERFGPIGNERYRAYLEDIRASGALVLALVNDMLELSRMEAGQLELTFADIDLNMMVNECVAAMQPPAARERVIMRTSLAANAPRITADVKSVRQIIINMLSNAIKLTGAGGQVIVSTGLSGARGVVLRIRHTGPGMSDSDVKSALEPFQTAVSAPTSAGSGLGLPLSKALAEANRGTFAVTKRVKDGTLVEVAFRPAPAASE
jgi:signal transduction histidine kinase